MPDRELTREETLKFIKEGTEGKLGFHALETHMNEKTKPTLHDLCIDELYALIEGQISIIIEQGAKINILMEKVEPKT
jgi:hypothetical protein